ncbi:hypothetical protein [Streptomyces sp. bgisy154]|uniref:hypothetical protein n=1 Tax=Streptomyces sp. bgisy154 TaxID=3413794 RepID=UPI003D725C5D
MLPCLRCCGDLLTPECTFRIDEITVHDVEEAGLGPALPRLPQILVLQRTRALRTHRPPVPRSAFRVDVLVGALRNLLGDDLQVRT